MNTILTPIKRAIIPGCALLGMTQALQTRMALSRHSGANAGRMQRFLAVRSLTGFLVAVLLASCGGGGGGGGGGRPGIPEISAGSPPSGATGVAYPGYTFTVASGGAAPFTWSETGALPPGLSLSTTGQLSGTPVTAGTYPITIAVADSSTPSLTGTRSVSLVIDDSPIVINPALPPAGIVGNSYADFVFDVASGGSPPFNWAVTAGALPTGLTLASDGSLSGTPTAADSFTFTVTVTDSFATPATNSVTPTIVVSESLAPTIISAQPRTAIEGVDYDPPFTFTASDGLAPLVWSETGPLPGLVFSLDGVLSGTPSGAGIFPISLDVKDALNRSAPSAPVTVRVALARPDMAFVPTGSMSVARYGHAATLLLDGKVLITGGEHGSGPGLSAELYDPSTGLFTATTGSMTVARIAHTATLLNSGKVLIAGGDPSGAASAELYDPATGTFAATGNMTVARAGHTATLLTGATLPNYGKVLIAGGDLSGTAAELYDPVTETFTATGSMTDVRTLQLVATLLLGGKVLMVGGGPTSAETYDPMAGVFTVTTGDLAVAQPPTATGITDGRVLITGTSAAAQLFNPATGLFVVVGSLAAGGAFGSTATLRNDGSVLVAGGADVRPLYRRRCHWDAGHLHCTSTRIGYAWMSLSPTELFAPESEGFIEMGEILTRAGHTATLLADGSVLVAGGVNQSKYTGIAHEGKYTVFTESAIFTFLSSAELYR